MPLIINSTSERGLARSASTASPTGRRSTSGPETLSQPCSKSVLAQTASLTNSKTWPSTPPHAYPSKRRRRPRAAACSPLLAAQSPPPSHSERRALALAAPAWWVKRAPCSSCLLVGAACIGCIGSEADPRRRAQRDLLTGEAIMADCKACATRVDAKFASGLVVLGVGLGGPGSHCDSAHAPTTGAIYCSAADPLLDTPSSPPAPWAPPPRPRRPAPSAPRCLAPPAPQPLSPHWLRAPDRGMMVLQTLQGLLRLLSQLQCSLKRLHHPDRPSQAK